MQVFFRECSEINTCRRERQEAKLGERRDPNIGPMTASADPVGALELEEPFRVLLNCLVMAGSLILLPAIRHSLVSHWMWAALNGETAEG